MALFLGSEAIDLYLSAFENGKTAFVHTAYSNDGGQTFENDPAHAAYIGFRFDYEAEASTNPSDYIWTQVKYDSLYLHIKYKDNADSTTFSTSENAKYIGICVNGDSRDTGLTMSDFSWHRIAYDEKFIYIAYSKDGSTIAADSTGAKYVGFCNTTSASKPTAYSAYTWTQFAYDKEYFYIAYANGSNQIITNSANAVQIGFCVSTSATKPNTYGAYTWTNITYNENADQGVSVNETSENKTVYLAGYDTVAGDLEYNQSLYFNPSTGALTATKVYNAVWNDYAEWFEKADVNEEIEPGDVCIWTGEGVTRCTERSQKAVVGIYSDSYGYILGGENLENMEDNKEKFVPIGLKGRVNANVIGSVEIGDLITTSMELGCGVVDNHAPQGCIIGKALEASDNLAKKKIKVLLV